MEVEEVAASGVTTALYSGRPFFYCNTQCFMFENLHLSADSSPGSQSVDIVTLRLRYIGLQDPPDLVRMRLGREVGRTRHISRPRFRLWLCRIGGDSGRRVFLLAAHAPLLRIVMV